MKLSKLAALVGVGGLIASLIVISQLPASAQEQVVFTSDFEDGTTEGWFGRGSATVTVSDAQANTGDASLLVADRADTWQGPGRDMRDVLLPGATYQIEAFVRLADAASGTVHMTVQRTPTGGDTAFERVASDVAVTDSEWTRVAGSYVFSSEENDELQLYLESPDPTVSFYLDSVTITGTDLPDQVLAATDFEDGTTQGWGPRGDEVAVAATQDDAHSGEWSLVTTGRTAGWNGPSFDLTPFVEAGETYSFSLFLKLTPGQDPATMRVSLQADADGESTFTNLTPNTEVTADDWVEFSGTFTAAEADAYQLYAETDSDTLLQDFYLDDFTFSGLAPPEIEDLPPLFEELADHFPVGVAIDQRETIGPSAELLTRHFNQITAENDMKPEEIQPEEGVFTFEDGDALVEFADQHGLRVYGHTLIWHSQVPDWFFEDEDGNPLSGDNPEHRQLLLDRMETHIATIAEHYGDRMWAWDVVNEAIDESQADGLRRSPWYNIIGPDYLDHAFRFARQYFGPDVKLYLNDFNTEFPAKREAMFNVVSGMLDRGVPIDGVGHQLHLSLSRPVSGVDDTIERFRELPVEQAVTELDVAISLSTNESLPAPPPERLVQQGYYYRDLFEVLRSHSDVLTSVTSWGLHDGRSWLRRDDRQHEAPLIFSDRLQAKPAYYGIVDPEQLPHFPQTLEVPAGTAEVDGEVELLWDLVPGTEVATGSGTTFQVRWDEANLYVLVEVADETADAGDVIDLYVDDANAKAGDYQPGDAHYMIERDGSVNGDATAVVVETDAGYRAEVALPLLTPGTEGREVGFDVRVTDEASGNRLSWSDQSHEQDTDTSRWGTLTLIEQVRHVDIPYATTTPTVDGQIDPIWATAPTVRTEVTVEGDPDGAKGDFRLLWDEQRLYVLAEVADPQLDAGSSNPWEQDSIEIFVDPNNTKSGAFKLEDGQYRINFENHQTINGALDVIGDNLTSAAEVVDGGYLIEASVELDGMEPQPGSFIGLELQVNDGTDGVRTAVHTWHDPTGQSFQDTSRWGVARFVEAEAPACDQTITGQRVGGLVVSEGTVCVDGAKLIGPVTVKAGASLQMTDSQVIGPFHVTGADVVQVHDSRFTGPVTISGVTGELDLSGNHVTGPVTVTNNTTGSTPIVVSANQVIGPLFCSGNEPPPVNLGSPNTVIGPKAGQCTGL